MEKKKYINIFIVIIFIFLLSFFGYTIQAKEKTIFSNNIHNIEFKRYEQLVLSLNMLFQEIIDKRLQESDVEYEKIIKKIWVADSASIYLNDASSFVITDINDEEVSGWIATLGVCLPCTYTYERGENIAAFSGKIEDGVATCKFEDVSGNKGYIVLNIKDEEHIEAEIKYDGYGQGEESDIKNIGQFEGIHQFHPLKFSDCQYAFIDGYEKKWQIELEKWGNVQFIIEISKVKSAKAFPVAFLVDEEDNLLYYFDIWPAVHEVTNIEIYDYDENGINDIVITGDLSSESGDEYVYFQMENGWFSSKGYSYMIDWSETPILDQRTYEIELYPEKSVTLVYEEREREAGSEARELILYTIDEEGELFYFPQYYGGWYRLIDPVEVNDFNGDGFNDIRFSFYSLDDESTKKIVYYQMANGWFLYQ